MNKKMPRPELREWVALFRLMTKPSFRRQTKMSLDLAGLELPPKAFCYAALNKVSRSFAVVIRHLPESLRDAVCVFYLVLRGLDSIEDDSGFPAEKKLPLLRNFYSKNFEKGWSIVGVGDSEDYRILLQHYDKVSEVFRGLEAPYQEVISDICKRMGEGMALFSGKEIQSVAGYDRYCHYVAGLVGLGLSQLFTASGKETEQVAAMENQANSMGLFLQKTNIIRDYHEDLLMGRTFWPKEIWGKYATNLVDFSFAAEKPSSLACLDELVLDALGHVEDCIAYMSVIQDPDVFRFCAIPQAMAIHTLERVYHNPGVFTSKVSMHKAVAARIMLDIRDLQDLLNEFKKVALRIKFQVSPWDPHYKAYQTVVDRIIKACNDPGSLDASPSSIPNLELEWA